MSEHTKSPWEYGGTAISNKEDLIRIFRESADAHVGDVGNYFCEVYSEDGKRIAFIGPTSVFNARRIVACVNACAGMDILTLEAGGIIESEKLYSADLSLQRIQKQRDELLELVKQSYRKQNAEYLDLLVKYAGTQFENDPAVVRLRDWVKKADRLIAEATC